MLAFTKTPQFKIIAITVAMTLFFESTVYGTDLCDVRHLRVPMASCIERMDKVNGIQAGGQYPEGDGGGRFHFGSVNVSNDNGKKVSAGRRLFKYLFICGTALFIMLVPVFPAVAEGFGEIVCSSSVVTGIDIAVLTLWQRFKSGEIYVSGVSRDQIREIEQPLILKGHRPPLTLRTFYSSLSSFLDGYAKKPKVQRPTIAIATNTLARRESLTKISEPKAAPKTIRELFIKVLPSTFRLPVVKIAIALMSIQTKLSLVKTVFRSKLLSSVVAALFIMLVPVAPAVAEGFMKLPQGSYILGLVGAGAIIVVGGLITFIFSLMKSASNSDDHIETMLSEGEKPVSDWWKKIDIEAAIRFLEPELVDFVEDIKCVPRPLFFANGECLWLARIGDKGAAVLFANPQGNGETLNRPEQILKGEEIVNYIEMHAVRDGELPKLIEYAEQLTPKSEEEKGISVYTRNRLKRQGVEVSFSISQEDSKDIMLGLDKIVVPHAREGLSLGVVVDGLKQGSYKIGAIIDRDGNKEAVAGIEKSMKIEVRRGDRFWLLITDKANDKELYWGKPLTVVSQADMERKGYISGWKRRLVDIAGVCLLAVPVSVIVPITAGIIKIGSRSEPAFFVQPRVGKNLEIFNIYKLRTMSNGRETKIGKILRKTGVDELPQWLNMLKGEMSLFGYRPQVQSAISQEVLEIAKGTKPGFDQWGILPRSGIEERIGILRIRVKDWSSWLVYQTYQQRFFSWRFVGKMFLCVTERIWNGVVNHRNSISQNKEIDISNKDISSFTQVEYDLSSWKGFPLNICVGTYFSDRITGLRNYVESLYEQMATISKVRIHMFCFSNDRHTSTFVERVGLGEIVFHTIYLHPSKLQYISLKSMFSIIRVLFDIRRKENVNLAHIHSPYIPIVALSFSLLSISGIPLVTTSHRAMLDWTWSWKQIGGKLFANVMRPLLGKKLGVSNVAARTLGKKAEVIGSFVDTSLFDPEKANPKIFLQKNNITAKHLIFYSSRIIPMKGQLDLVEVARNINKKRPNLHFKIIILGPSNDDSYLEKIRDKILSYQLEDYIMVLPPLQHDELPDAIASADIIAMPSYSEGLSLTALEALSMKKPVVANRVGGVPEVVIAGKTGFLVEPHNTEEMADRIIYLLDHPEVTQEMGEKGREFVMKNYSVGGLVKRHLELYSQLTNRELHTGI